MANVTTSRADLYAALMQKCGFEVLEEEEKAKRLRISGRCALERWSFFLPVIYTLNKASSAAGALWTADISKKYFNANDRVLYSWRIIFQTKTDDLRAQYPAIISVIRSAPRPARVELDRQLLPGYQPGDVRGGVNGMGKGVQSAGSLPLALTRNRG